MDNIYKKGIIVMGVILMTLILFLGYNLSKNEIDINEISKIDEKEYSTENLIMPEIEENNQIANDIKKNDIQSSDTLAETNIKVDVDGAVNKPGVYDLENGSTVFDAINIAGGLTNNAETKNINRASEVKKGEKIYIPEKNEDTAGLTLDLDLYSSDKININLANKEQLMTLNGIGEVYAQRIIDYRNKNKFSSVIEIKEVKGIGEKTFEKIEDDIYIN